MTHESDNPVPKSELVRRATSDSLPLTIKVTDLSEAESKDQDANGTESEDRVQGRLPLLVLGAVLLIAGGYVLMHLGRGWVPADDGTLAQSAARVYGGQLPQRDFDEIYTGGLSVIHALAFRLFGVDLMSLRICAFLFFLAWIPAVYCIALRFTSALGAGLVTLLAVAWSFPNYPAAMPSWYNLFFATFGAVALLRFVETRRYRWLSLAGACGGVSLLIKVIGAYYIAGALLALTFIEQDHRHESETPRNSLAYRIFSFSALALFLAVVASVFRTRLGPGEFFQFVLPASLIVGLIITSELNVRGSASPARFVALFRLVGSFLFGVSLPILLFLTPYALSGSVGIFFRGVAGSAIARAAGLGTIRPAGPEKALYALLLVAVIAASRYLRTLQNPVIGLTVACGLAFLALRPMPFFISGTWFSAATLTPVLVLVAVALVYRGLRSNSVSTLRQRQIVVLCSVAALCSLVQYPFAAPIYLCYSLPLTLLAATAIVGTVKRQPATYLLPAIAGFYLVFGVVTLVPDYIYELTHKVGPMQELRIPRAGGLNVEYASDMTDFIHFLQQHSANGLMYAGNDCPELYFLADLKNVTRDDTGASPEEILHAVRSTNLNLVVINNAPFFPQAVMRDDVRAEVQQRFPNHRQFGIFEVFWKQ